MELIIDIPEEYKALFDTERCKSKFDSLATNEFGYVLRKAFENGTPLDSNSERAEVQAYFDGEAYGWEQGRKALINDLKAEIAEEICLTYNPYTNETKYTIEHLKLFEILDNIGKAESEESK